MKVGQNDLKDNNPPSVPIIEAAAAAALGSPTGPAVIVCHLPFP